MVPQRHRLVAPAEFREVSRAGRRAGGRTIVIHVDRVDGDRVDEESSAKVGFVVGKTVGNAVVRNRVRRRLRHAVLELLDGFEPGSRIVVRALPASAEAGYAELSAELRSLTERVLGASSPVGGVR